MFKFNLPPSITADILPRYFLYYAQMAEGYTDGVNISIVSCSQIPKNSKYTDYYCLDLDELPDL
jgi:hypothetical protein